MLNNRQHVPCVGFAESLQWMQPQAQSAAGVIHHPAATVQGSASVEASCRHQTLPMIPALVSRSTMDPYLLCRYFSGFVRKCGRF
jgi:hypothetical protein